MGVLQSSIQSLRQSISSGKLKAVDLAREAIGQANSSPNRNTYVWFDPEWTMRQAARVMEAGKERRMPQAGNPKLEEDEPDLWGLPVSVKDCFDLKGAPTSCGTRYYRELRPSAAEDSALVAGLRAEGAVITGKTHLHPLAYGITGENPDFGDALQPGSVTAAHPAGLLTGGSSSGAAASVMEGSAVAAIGTDTGGSIRVPAALGGLVGYRATLGRGDWRGGDHLAASFDTLGWLFRHMEDAPLLGRFFAPKMPLREPTALRRVGVVAEEFLYDCEPEILAAHRAAIRELEEAGIAPVEIAVPWWAEAMEIFAPIQAFEAAQIHAGRFERFEPAIRQRLEWGASLSATEMAALRERREAFRDRMDELLHQHTLLLLPTAPIRELVAGADHAATRPRLLRYTIPVSLAGMPAVTYPGQTGGTQLIAARENDEALLKLVENLGIRRKFSNRDFGIE